MVTLLEMLCFVILGVLIALAEYFGFAESYIIILGGIVALVAEIKAIVIFLREIRAAKQLRKIKNKTTEEEASE